MREAREHGRVSLFNLRRSRLLAHLNRLQRRIRQHGDVPGLCPQASVRELDRCAAEYWELKAMSEGGATL